MNSKDVFLLGYITKTHGFKGEVSLKLDTDNPEHYATINAFFVEQNNQLIPYFIENITLLNNGIAKVKIEDINDLKDAQNLVGKSIFLPLEILPKLKDNKFYYHEIIGFKVMDTKHGDIGKIIDINDQTAQVLMIIEKDDKEIIIPLVDEFIVKVDKKLKEFHVKTPEGLIELYIT
jgi:16S rRNA processing protein RimM